MSDHLPTVEQSLSAARAGSREALGQALQAHRAYLMEVARGELDPALRVKGGASDLVQEAFLDAARAFGRFHGESAPELRAWLRCLLLRRLAKHGRRYRATIKRRLGREVALAGDGPGGDETPSRGAADGEELQRLHRAIDRLPDDYRLVIHLRYREGRTFEEIGPLMGRTANAVRLLWLRAVERVRHQLGPKG